MITCKECRKQEDVYYGWCLDCLKESGAIIDNGKIVGKYVPLPDGRIIDREGTT